MSLKLVGEVALDGSGFERGISKLGHSALGLKHMLVAAFGGWTIQSAIAKTGDAASKLVDKSQRLDVTIEKLQLLEQAAKDGGSSLDTLAKGFENLDVARAKALDGSKQGQAMLARFGQLGISKDDLLRKTAADLFMGPLRSAAEGRNAEVLGPIIKDVLGKASRELLPVLKTDFEALRQKMEAFGLIMSTETAVHLDAFGDQVSLISTLLTNALAPAIVNLVEWMLWAVSHKGFMRDVLEGADFKLRQRAGMAGLKGYTTPSGYEWSAERRAAEAVRALPIVSEHASSVNPHRFSDIFDKIYLGKEGAFGDFLGSSYHDLSLYLQKLITPVSDVTNASAKGAGEDMGKLQRIVEDFGAQIEAEVARLKKPKAPDFVAAPEEATKPTKEKAFREKGDSLTRVGNFLGSSRDVLADLAQRQVTLLQQIVENTRPLQLTGDDTGYPPD